MNDLSFPSFSIDNFSIGDQKNIDFLVTLDQINNFSLVSGDNHPVHISRKFAQDRGFANLIAHGMYISSLVSSFITREFIGSNGILIGFSSDFRSPVEVNTELNCFVRITGINKSSNVMTFLWKVNVVQGVEKSRGTASAWVPSY